jgi:capsid portal protein
MDALGRHYASYVNYRLIKKGGIPQVIVTVNGGTLTDESYNDLMAAFDEWASTTDTWTNVAVLESVPESMGLEDKGSAKIEIKYMSDSRKEDLMFDKHSGGVVNNVRNSFRLTPMYTGSTDDVNRATAMSSMRITEQQVFNPEREAFDEVMGWVFRDGLGITLWKYVSNGPKITGDDEFRRGFDYFAKWGALTINEAVALCNTSMGLEMSKFEDDWANYPIPIVLKLVELGQLPGLKIGNEEVVAPQPSVQTEGFGQPDQDNGKTPPNLAVVPDKAAKLKALQGMNIFSNDEISFYDKLISFQDAWDKLGAAPKEVTEEDSKL